MSEPAAAAKHPPCRQVVPAEYDELSSSPHQMPRSRCPQPQRRRAVLYTHGNDGDISRWLTVVTRGSWLTRYADAVVLWDFRGYGRSQGSPYARGFQGSSEDLVKLWLWLQRWLPTLLPYCGGAAPCQWDWSWYGRSMGGYLSLLALYQLGPQQPRPARLLLEAPLCCPAHSVRHAVSAWLPQAWLLRWVLPPGSNHHAAALLQKLQKRYAESPLAVFLIATRSDALIPSSDSEELARVLPRGAAYLVDDTDHNGLAQHFLYQQWLQASLSCIV